MFLRLSLIYQIYMIVNLKNNYLTFSNRGYPKRDVAGLQSKIEVPKM